MAAVLCYLILSKLSFSKETRSFIHLTATLTLAEGGATGVDGAGGVAARGATGMLYRSTPCGVRSPVPHARNCPMQYM